MLGALLLNDEHGAKTEAIIASNPIKPARETTHEILSSWLKGGGKEPVTWGTFTAVLKQIGLKSLAQDFS